MAASERASERVSKGAITLEAAACLPACLPARSPFAAPGFLRATQLKAKCCSAAADRGSAWRWGPKWTELEIVQSFLILKKA